MIPWALEKSELHQWGINCVFSACSSTILLGLIGGARRGFVGLSSEAVGGPLLRLGSSPGE